MSGKNEHPVASVRYAFGVKHDIRETVSFLDSRTLLYPVGQYVAKHSIIGPGLEPKQSDVELTPCNTAVTALCLCPDRQYLAVAEKRPLKHVDLEDEQ